MKKVAFKPDTDSWGNLSGFSGGEGGHFRHRLVYQERPERGGACRACSDSNRTADEQGRQRTRKENCGWRRKSPGRPAGADLGPPGECPSTAQPPLGRSNGRCLSVGDHRLRIHRPAKAGFGAEPQSQQFWAGGTQARCRLLPKETDPW